MPCLSGHGENLDGKGNEGNQGNIIGNPHGGEEAHQDQYQTKRSDIGGSQEYFLRKQKKDSGFVIARHDRHKAEEESEHPEINIGKIIHAWGYKKHGNDGSQSRDA